MVKAAVLGAAGQIGQPLSLLLKSVRYNEMLKFMSNDPKANVMDRALSSRSYHCMILLTALGLQSISIILIRL